MSDILEDSKINSEIKQFLDDPHKNRKVLTQQSLNTKQFIKKMTSKKPQPNEKAQPKITSFLSISNSNFINAQKKQVKFSFNINPNDQIVKSLQERMQQKDLEIQKMKKSKQIDEHRYSSLIKQSRENKRKSRQAIAKSMLQASQLIRLEKKVIDPNLGYFRDGTKTFIEGPLLTNLRQKVKFKQQLLKQLQDDRNSKDAQKRQQAVTRIEFMNKEVTSLKRELQNTQQNLNAYKQAIKLADKQRYCQYALQGWPIVYENYQSLELLGKGGFGQVYKCYDLQNNQVVAIKVNRFNQDPYHQQDFVKHVNRQAQIMKNLNHPYIGKFIKLLECQCNRIVFVLQYCSGPQLSLFIKKNGCVQEKQAKTIIKQIFAALSYLSSLNQKIIHYDLKPSNIMLHNGIVKILDFGLCKPMGTEQSKIQLTSQGVGTYWYLPPQTFNENEPSISTKVDVWSAGVIFYQMLYGKKPFGHGISQQKIYNNGVILEARKVQFPNQTPKKYRVSQGAKHFIRQCLAYNPAQRLNPGQAYEHEYFIK